MRRVVPGALLCLVALTARAVESRSPGRSLRWTTPAVVSSGRQVALAAGPKGHVHLVATEYVELDREGAVIARAPVADERQNPLDFPPAIAVGPDGAVHAITRHGGDYNSGHTIRYRRRNPEGKWDLDLEISGPVARNYVVGAVVAADGRTYVAHSFHPTNEDMNSYIQLYEIAHGEARHLGKIDGRYSRSDADFRLAASGRFLHIAAGNPWPSGSIHYFIGLSGRGLPKKKTVHRSGAGRKACPCLYTDERGFVHLTYGADQTVWYNKYTPDGRKLARKDIQLAEDLGKWHLSSGMSVVAASADGRKVVVIVMRSDGTKTMSDARLCWRYSPDGGASWSDLEETGFRTSGGEGRQRPSLVAVGSRFFLVFAEGSTVKMSTLDLGGVK